MTNLAVNLDTLQHAKQKVVDLSIEFGPKALTALLIMVIGFFVARWVGKFVASCLQSVVFPVPEGAEIMKRIPRLSIEDRG